MNVKIENAFAWKFLNVPKIESGIQRSKERLTQLESDINIGFEKSSGRKLLENLEYLLRDNLYLEIHIPLKQVPQKSPHYLDDENDYIGHDKIIFTEVVLTKIAKGKNIIFKEKVLHVQLDENAVNELFTRLYINFEIYATSGDNVVRLLNERNEEIRLVIWGVIDGKPIFY